MKVNEYLVLRDCIEKGVTSGWYRAHKHNDAPDEESIRMAIEEAVLAEITEYFHFEGTGYETAD